MSILLIDNKNITDPTINLALEEYCVRNLDMKNDYLLFYVNAPSIIIGKHQNTIEEINQVYIKERGIHVVRRISGDDAAAQFEVGVEFAVRQVRELLDSGVPGIHFYVLNKSSANEQGPKPVQ